MRSLTQDLKARRNSEPQILVRLSLLYTMAVHRKGLVGITIHLRHAARYTEGMSFKTADGRVRVFRED